MSKRLQVLFPNDEYAELKRRARKARQSLGEWVRSALRRVADSESAKQPEEKMRFIGKAFDEAAPIAEIDELERQIESGYLK